VTDLEVDRLQCDKAVEMPSLMALARVTAERALLRHRWRKTWSTEGWRPTKQGSATTRAARRSSAWRTCCRWYGRIHRLAPLDSHFHLLLRSSILRERMLWLGWTEEASICYSVSLDLHVAAIRRLRGYNQCRCPALVLPHPMMKATPARTSVLAPALDRLSRALAPVSLCTPSAFGASNAIRCKVAARMHERSRR
jgi:hypothetical protein